MDIDSDATQIPRAELVKTIVAALPVTPDPEDIAADGEESDGGPRLEYVTQLETNCDNKQLAAALSSLEINLYSTETLELTGQLKGHSGPLTQLAFAPTDSSCLFSASEDGTVRLDLNQNVWQYSAARRTQRNSVDAAAVCSVARDFPLVKKAWLLKNLRRA